MPSFLLYAATQIEMKSSKINITVKIPKHFIIKGHSMANSNKYTMVQM